MVLIATAADAADATQVSKRGGRVNIAAPDYLLVPKGEVCLWVGGAFGKFGEVGVQDGLMVGLVDAWYDTGSESSVGIPVEVAWLKGMDIAGTKLSWRCGYQGGKKMHEK